MPMSARRRFLHERTGPIHRQLDECVGTFSDIPAYLRYIRGMLAFRRPIETQLASTRLPAEFGAFAPNYLADALGRDIAALGASPDVATASGGQSLPDLSADGLLGTLYVLEGSTLGARLLVRRAAALGLGPGNGAEHLQQQSSDLGNWNAFAALLDSATEVDDETMAQAALATFAHALNAFEKA